MYNELCAVVLHHPFWVYFVMMILAIRLTYWLTRWCSRYQHCLPTPELRFLCVCHFPHPPCVCVGLLQILWFPPTVQKMQLGRLARINFP